MQVTDKMVEAATELWDDAQPSKAKTMTDTAKDLIATIYIEGRNQPIGFLHASAILAGLQEAGCRILGPDEVQALRDEALEEAAALADNYGASPGLPDGKTHAFRKHRARIATAIRSLKGGRKNGS